MNAPFLARAASLLTLLAQLTAGAVFHSPRAMAAEPQTPARIHSGKAIRTLLITGGCCHNYRFQSQAMTNGLSARGNFEWTVLHEPTTGTRAELALYSDPKWADPYDLVIHNECFADTDNVEHLKKIVAAHRAGKPAVVIHCAMHTYRAAKVDEWREFLGVTSRMHEHQSRYVVRPTMPGHPALRGFPATWTTPMDELYIIEKLWPAAKVLAVSASEKTGKEQPVVWINDYHGTRVFGTTYGHSDDTFRDPVFIHLLATGAIWAAGRD